MAEADDFLPRILCGRYQLDAQLGHGGMGIVYRGTDLTMRRPVAVKLVRSSDGAPLDEEVCGRFLREAKNTARIRHENIIEVYDLGRTDEGDLFFVMELLYGESLSTRLRRDHRLDAETTVHIGRQICAALHVAHTSGIIHRDMKPANVMLLDRTGSPDFVKVLDFGVSKSYSADQTQLTHTGMLVGTIEYMAPEQIMGRTVDSRTDVYALGVVLYRMLSGKAPFRDGGVPALIHQHLNIEPMSLTDRVEDLSEALDRVVLRCLAKDPDRRYPTMSDLSQALAAAVAGGEEGLLDFEYHSDDDIEDPYASGDETEIARSPLASSPRMLDEPTVRIDRPLSLTPASSGQRRAEPTLLDETEVFHSEPRPCAMCQTVNAPFTKACVACGVSLAAIDQAAVRQRVTRPPEPPRPAPPMSGAYWSGAPVPMADPARISWTPPPSLAAQVGAPPPPSVWERLLSWARLRSR